MKYILTLATPFLLLLTSCNNNDELERISDDQTTEELNFISIYNFEKDQITFEYNTEEDAYFLSAYFTYDADITVIVEEQEFDMQLQSLGQFSNDENGENGLYAAIEPLDALPVSAGDEIEYEVELEEVIYEGSIELISPLSAEFPDTLLADEPFEYEWEIDEDPQSLYNVFITDSDIGEIPLVWPLSGDLREAEFDMESDFEDQEYPSEIYSPYLSLWALNFDNFAQDELVISSLAIQEQVYDYEEEDFESEQLLLHHRPQIQQRMKISPAPQSN